MPPIRSSASKHHTYIISVILLLSKIIPIYSRYAKKKLIYIIIITPFSRQPSSYLKYIKLNIRSSCNIKLILDAEYL